MDPELKYTQIQLTQYYPQLMPVINEEPTLGIDETQSRIRARRESIAIHPTCDCTNCCCYFCCGCPELYTPLEMNANKDKLTICPLTSKVINPALATDNIPGDDDENININNNKSSTPGPNPAVCLLSPITLVIDLVTLIPRLLISHCN
jgi:hypothetical protein